MGKNAREVLVLLVLVLVLLVPVRAKLSKSTQAELVRVTGVERGSTTPPGTPPTKEVTAPPQGGECVSRGGIEVGVRRALDGKGYTASKASKTL